MSQPVTWQGAARAAATEKEQKKPSSITVGLPAIFLPGSLSRHLMTKTRASPKAWCSACGCTSGVSSQSADNPPDTTNSTDLHNRAPRPQDYSNPSKFYLSNSLSFLWRREAGNKTSGLKGSSPALPRSLAPLDCPPQHPPSPPNLPPTPRTSHPCCSAYLPHIQFNLGCD